MVANFVLAAGLSVAAVSPAVARQTSPQQPEDASSGTILTRGNEIFVDSNCRIFPDPTHPNVGKKAPKPRKNSTICHLESVRSSAHPEEHVSGKVILRSWVQVNEQEFVLQNVTADPATFVVSVGIDNGWMIDSDPRPDELTADSAVWRVSAQPGQTVRLHTGERHTLEETTRVIKTVSPAGSPH